MIVEQDREKFRTILEGQREILLTTHMNPDGDAIGSEIGMRRFLLSRGHTVRVINHDPTPVTLRFLEDPARSVEIYDPARHDPQLAAAGLVILLDNSAPDRLGRMEAAMRAAGSRVLCIDHHPTRGTPWAHNILDEASCATAAMVFQLTRDLGYSLDRAAAQALYVGLATDTGFFRFNSTTPLVHEIAAELLRAGVDPALCYQEVYERNPLAHTRLLGAALADMKIAASGAIASIRITREMVERFDARDVDTSEMTTALLATDGVRIALLLRETEDGRVKVSLRSKGSLDVHGLASEFGGGGHRNASGIVLSGAIGPIEKQVLERATALIAG